MHVTTTTILHIDATDGLDSRTLLLQLGTILRTLSAAGPPGTAWHVHITGNHPRCQDVQDLCVALGYA